MTLGETIGGINPTDYKPATKKQLNILFQKMKEAGYEWDAEKKELKKIEQKHAWSEEDERKLQLLIVMCDETKGDSVTYSTIYREMEELKTWLKSIKDRYTCKPSDEQMKVLNEVLNFAANHESPHWNDYIFGTLINLIRQLKKLREE